MKSKSYILGISLLSVLALFSCKKENELAFSTNPREVGQTEYDKMYVGDTKQLEVQSFGVKSSDGYHVNGVSWSSSDDFIASVSSDGVVTANKVGSVKIIGKFNGKSVYSSIVISGRKETYFEPDIKAGMSEAIAKELIAGKLVMRGNLEGTSPYSVLVDTAANRKSDYTVYLFGENTSAMVNLLTDEAVKETAEVFLPERYNKQEGGYFNNPYGVRVMQSSSPYKNVVLYTDDSKPSTAEEFSAAYKKVSKGYVADLANPETYSKASLGLENDFKYEKRDVNAINSIISECNTLIDKQGATITEIEERLGVATDELADLFLDAARLEGTDMCYAKLPATPTEENFYEAALDSIQKLDDKFTALYDTASNIIYLDRLVTSSQKSYSGFLTRKVIDDNVIKPIDKEFETYKGKQADYSEKAYALFEVHYNVAIEKAKGSCSLSDANNAMNGQKNADKDVIKKTDEESQKAKLDTEFAKYNESDYTAENWALLNGIYGTAKAALEDGQLYYSIVSTAIDEMAKIEKKQ